MEFKNPTAIKVYDYGQNNIVYLVVGDDGNDRLVNMGTDGTWYEVPLTAYDEIVGVDLYDEEIYILEIFSRLVHKIRWPDVYLSNFSGINQHSPERFSFPNSISIPFSEGMPYICVFEQWTQVTGGKLFVQGVDIKNFTNAINTNGTAVCYEYRLPTNALVTETVRDHAGNIVKTLNDSMIIDSSLVVSGVWYGDNNDGNPVPPGEYYLQCYVSSKWEWGNNGNPIYKRVSQFFKLSDISDNNTVGDFISEKISAAIPQNLIFIPNKNYGSDTLLNVGTKFNERMRTLIKFDLTDTKLTQRDKIVSASIILHAKEASNMNNVKINIHEINTPWEECNSSWNVP
jgi:hypothetical protein